jgi:hypothetical protein
MSDSKKLTDLPPISNSNSNEDENDDDTLDDENLDMDINNYSNAELLKMFEIREPSYEKIRSRTSQLISQFRSEGNIEMVSFIKNVEMKLIEDLYKESGVPYYNDQEDNKTLVGQWYQNNYLRQANHEESSKPSYRRNRVKVFEDSSQYPMKREFLGVNHVYNIDIAQGEVNPNLVNTTSQLITIDSRYRELIFPYDSSNAAIFSSPTNFNMTLSSNLNQCISLSVNSVTLPKTWYNVDSVIGNNFFYVGGTPVVIPSGFYDTTSLQTEIQSSINNILAVDPLFPLNNINYNTKTGKFVLNFTNAAGIIPLDVSLIFWDKDGSYNVVNSSQSTSFCSNQPLNQPKLDYN